MQHLKLCKIAVHLLCFCGILQPEEEIHQHEYEDHAPGNGEDDLSPSRIDRGACKGNVQDHGFQEKERQYLADEQFLRPKSAPPSKAEPIRETAIVISVDSMKNRISLLMRKRLNSMGLFSFQRRFECFDVAS